ncbi:uncharacterized protein LOC136074569 [Hydra vulgaris]|uniref:Uncharacterized protein LOC136074569 n=1 Tax=Hydra vulgaris TaxID=6087 RepID=A0ABM4B2D0_HYDVU
MIKEELKKERKTPISVDTVKRRLRRVGLIGLLACRKPLLRRVNKQKRRRLYVERLVGERISNICLSHSVKHGGSNVMICGGFGGGGGGKVDDLVQIKSTMDKKVYRSILIHHVVPCGN